MRGPGQGRGRRRSQSRDRSGSAGGSTPDHSRSAEPVQPADPESTAREVVLRQLTMGARTRAQLYQALVRKRIPDDVSAAVLDRFEAVDLVDDAEFSRQWVESRHAGRGLARRALAHELRQRGVAEETLKQAVDHLSADDEFIAAREVVRRKLRTLSRPGSGTGAPPEDPERLTRRLAGLLARKGYNGSVAWRAIREEYAAFADAEMDADS